MLDAFPQGRGFLGHLTSPSRLMRIWVQGAQPWASKCYFMLSFVSSLYSLLSCLRGPWHFFYTVTVSVLNAHRKSKSHSDHVWNDQVQKEFWLYSLAWFLQPALTSWTLCSWSRRRVYLSHSVAVVTKEVMQDFRGPLKMGCSDKLQLSGHFLNYYRCAIKLDLRLTFLLEVAEWMILGRWMLNKHIFFVASKVAVRRCSQVEGEPAGARHQNRMSLVIWFFNIWWTWRKCFDVENRESHSLVSFQFTLYPLKNITSL